MVVLVATLIDLLSRIVGEEMAVELVNQAVARLPWQRTAGTAATG
jgi:ABC-type phosphate transport system permease subunit